MPKIAIRADGSKNIGMGHIVRCIALYKKFNQKNLEIIFITNQNEDVESLLKYEKIKFIGITYETLYEELKIVNNIIKENEIDIFITDSYYIDEYYLREIKPKPKLLVSIDDNGICKYPSDIVINGNLYATDIIYNKVDQNIKLLLGSKYTILREEFANKKPIEIKQNVNKILVTMGGSDINNFTKTVIESIDDLDCKVDIVIGNSYKYKEDIETIIRDNTKFNAIYNPKSMSHVMLNNDIAITSSGSTIYELAVLGIPSITTIQSENQINAAKKVEDLNIMINLGEFSKITKSQLKKSTKELMANYEKRKQMSETSLRFVSKNGTDNIIMEILKYYNNKYYI